MLIGGRWNSPGKLVIYGATTYPGAMLEVLVHARIGKIPISHVCVVADVPPDVTIEVMSLQTLPVGWDAPESAVARGIGDLWLTQMRSAILLVPSIVTRDDGNVLINPMHPDAGKISISEPKGVAWDERLFSFDRIPKKD
jgi:RES domain-containing protein